MAEVASGMAGAAGRMTGAAGRMAGIAAGAAGGMGTLRLWAFGPEGLRAGAFVPGVL
ncbi:MAG TPA: hypothetical protein VFP72_12255 [Kineosporiaceae bacterium]|nr:hypothetical protein [Kineosporiaceae bacterium]